MQHDVGISAFRAWAPAESPWSAWAKPVLFTYSPRVPADPPRSPAFLVKALPEPDARTCAVIDLHGADSVACALVLAQLGFQPVPLFNITSGPGRNQIDVGPILAALLHGVDVLRASAVPPDAPPAFILDRARLDGVPLPGSYDNRWMVFPQDFPSGRALRAGGIDRVALLRAPGRIGHDLRAVLRLWNRDGLSTVICDPESGKSEELGFASLSPLAALADHFRLVFHGLRVNSAGGFGGSEPDASIGSGGFA